MPSVYASIAATLALALGFSACSSSGSEKKSEAQQTPDAGNANGAADAGGTSKVDPFTGDCSSARWAKVSDACWSCLCGACAAKLDACDETCMAAFECAKDKQTLVNTGAEVMCEIRATTAACLSDPKLQAGAGALLNLDTCLIGAPKPAGNLRACASECGIVYPGDVCQRYPAGDGG